VTLAPGLAISVNVPFAPVLRSILKPSSLLELSFQDNWSWAALAWWCHPRLVRRKKIKIKYLRRFRLEFTLSSSGCCVPRDLKKGPVFAGNPATVARYSGLGHWLCVPPFQMVCLYQPRNSIWRGIISRLEVRTRDPAVVTQILYLLAIWL